MLFNSLTYAIFLPIVFAIYWLLNLRIATERAKTVLQLQNLLIVVVSYIFYGWWDWRFLILIALTSFCSWGSGLLISKKYSIFWKNGIFNGKTILVANIVLNLGILGVFKYYNFFVESFVEAFAYAGIHLQPHTLKIILPVGISFYTFQALSYSIDVYRKKIEPTGDIVAFFAFVSFFPQLVAGPIERATNLLPQFYVPRKFNRADATDGLRQMLWGLFKKIVIADNCATYVTPIFQYTEALPASTLLLGAFCFAMQIYCDFSGYSDIAIGTARLFGFNLKRNFNFPYFSRDIAEFWRRWHISLTTWFRDYVYIPLGGSRVSKAKIIRNTFVIFLLSGFWHGANWTFIAWGAFHALLFLPLILTGNNRKYTGEVAEGRLLPSFREALQIILTFLLVLIGWIFFRAENIDHALLFIGRLFDRSMFTVPGTLYAARVGLAAAALMLAVEWYHRDRQHGLQLSMKSRPLRWTVYFALIFAIWLFGGSQATFIYFQF